MFTIHLNIILWYVCVLVFCWFNKYWLNISCMWKLLFTPTANLWSTLTPAFSVVSVSVSFLPPTLSTVRGTAGSKAMWLHQLQSSGVRLSQNNSTNLHLTWNISVSHGCRSSLLLGKLRRLISCCVERYQVGVLISNSSSWMDMTLFIAFPLCEKFMRQEGSGIGQREKLNQNGPSEWSWIGLKCPRQIGRGLRPVLLWPLSSCETFPEPLILPGIRCWDNSPYWPVYSTQQSTRGSVSLTSQSPCRPTARHHHTSWGSAAPVWSEDLPCPPAACYWFLTR